MSESQFDRDKLAKWYADQHLKTDPGIRSVCYLRRNSPDREIRFVEINELIADRQDDLLEPIDFGVDTGTETEHRLFVLDVTPIQWDEIKRSSLALPRGWSLDDSVTFDNPESG